MYNSHVLSLSWFSSHPLHPPNSALLSGVLPPSTRCFLCYTVQVSESYREERAIYILKRHLNTTEVLLFLLCKDLQPWLCVSNGDVQNSTDSNTDGSKPLQWCRNMNGVCFGFASWLAKEHLAFMHCHRHKKGDPLHSCPGFSTASVQKWIGRLRHWNKCHFWPHRLTLYVSTSLPVLTLPSFPLSSDPTYLLPPSAVPFCQSAHHRGRRGRRGGGWGGYGFVILASSTLPCSSLSLFPLCSSVCISFQLFTPRWLATLTQKRSPLLIVKSEFKDDILWLH